MVLKEVGFDQEWYMGSYNPLDIYGRMALMMGEYDSTAFSWVIMGDKFEFG